MFDPTGSEHQMKWMVNLEVDAISTKGNETDVPKEAPNLLCSMENHPEGPWKGPKETKHCSKGKRFESQ